MMNEQQIAARLVELSAALVAKLDAQPWVGPDATISSSGRVRIGLYAKSCSDDPQFARGDTFEECFEAAFAIVADMPTPENKALHHHMKLLADVVDHGVANIIPDEYVDPARVTIKAMTDNLLTARAAE